MINGEKMTSSQNPALLQTHSDQTQTIEHTTEETSLLNDDATPSCFRYLLADSVSLLAVGGLAVLSAGIGTGVGAGVNALVLPAWGTLVGKWAGLHVWATCGFSANLGASMGAYSSNVGNFMNPDVRNDMFGKGLWGGMIIGVGGMITYSAANLSFTMNSAMIAGAVAGGAGLFSSLATEQCISPKERRSVVSLGRRLFGLYERPQTDEAADPSHTLTDIPRLR